MNKMKISLLILNLIIIFFFCFCQMNEKNSDENGGIINFEVSHHNDNRLMALVKVSLSEKGNIKILNTNGFRFKESSESNYEHEITVIGLRENTSYDFYIEADFENGNIEISDTIIFKTESAPDGAPEVSVLSKQDGCLEGITLFGLSTSPNDKVTGPVYWGFDEEGYVVWYYHGTGISEKAPSQAVIRRTQDNNLLIFLDSEIRVISFSGETIRSYIIPSAIKMHHDAIILPNNNIVFLAKETGVFNGNRILGDKIYELDINGNQVWSWSSFDYLDLNRFPGDLSKVESSNGMDWSHSNALFYNHTDDTFLLSVRSQSWIVKLDHKSGEIRWILGNDSMISNEYDESFFDLKNGTWFSNQHAPVIGDNGNILIYDNRNESGGVTNNSRAVIYEIDENNLYADQLWEYIAPKYTNSLGDVDFLSNNNIFVCAGGPEGRGSSDQFAHLIEVSSDNPAAVFWELKVKGFVYRAEKLEWGIFLR